MNIRIHTCILASFFILCSMDSFAASLMGEEVYFHRMSDNTTAPFNRLFEEGTFEVGPAEEYNDGTHAIDFSETGIRITELNSGGGGYGDVDPHEYRFLLPHRILGFSLTNSGFGALSSGDISFSDHLLIIDVGGLNTQENGFAEVQLVLAKVTLPTLSGVEMYFHRMSDNTTAPFNRLFEEGTFEVGPAEEYNDGTHAIDFSATSIRITELNPGGGGFGDVDPHEYRFFIPHRILGLSYRNNGFGNISHANFSFSDHLISFDIGGLDTDENGFVEIRLVYESPQSPVPSMLLLLLQ